MPAYGPLSTDESLVAYYQSTHDKQAVGELFKRHSLMCFAVCNKYLQDEEKARDATMAIFEKLFIDLETHTVQNFKGWFHIVSKNYCLMLLRKPELFVRMNDVPEENEDGFMQSGWLMHHTDEDKEYKLQELEKAIVELNDKQRVCIDLFYLKQKSYKEISEQTGYPDNEVRSHIQNGRRNLKNTLSQRGITFCLALIAWIQHTA